jgi:6-phosphogluconate dehydrogenase
MAGSDESAYDYIKPVLDSWLSRVGDMLISRGGAGHFVKMVHNGIEYGIMQSLGEGFEVLQKAPTGSI